MFEPMKHGRWPWDLVLQQRAEATADGPRPASICLLTLYAFSHPHLPPNTSPHSPPGEPLTADDLGVSGALAVLLKDAILPTLMQARSLCLYQEVEGWKEGQGRTPDCSPEESIAQLVGRGSTVLPVDPMDSVSLCAGHPLDPGEPRGGAGGQ